MSLAIAISRVVKKMQWLPSSRLGSVFFANWWMTALSAWLAMAIAVSVFAGVIAPYDFASLDLANRLSPPVFLGGTSDHLLGTDELGRDVFSRLLVAARLSLSIAFIASVLSAIWGVILGFLAAHYRGLVEQIVLMLVDLQAAIPFMVLALALLAFFGNSLPLFVCVMGFYGWERTARLARGLALSAAAQGYAQAVRQLGAHPFRVYFHHILPNIASTLVVAMTFNFPEIILLESGLSFLGLGVQPPRASLGNMVGFGREYLQTAPWIALAPSLIIVVTTLAISLLGDRLRDRLTPDQ